MQRIDFGFVLAAVFSALPTRACAEPITVLVHNYAAVSEPSLETAETEAARMLGTAGVLIRWVHCPDSSDAPRECQRLPDSMVLVIQLLPARATRHNVEPGAFGFALQPECHGFGSYAGVLCDRLDRLHSARISKSARGPHME
jgi:hypothetical protein